MHIINKECIFRIHIFCVFVNPPTYILSKGEIGERVEANTGLGVVSGSQIGT